MKDSFLMKSMDYLDDVYIDEAHPAAALPMKRLRRRMTAKWVSAVAGFCASVILIGHIVMPYLYSPAVSDDPGDDPAKDPASTRPSSSVVQRPVTPPPVYENAIYTAADIGKLFSGMNTLDAVGTSAYTKIYVPSAEDLHISDIPEDAYISIYERQTEQKALSKKEFAAFADRIVENTSEALGISSLSYTVEKEEATSYSEAALRAVFNRADEDASGCYLHASQTGTLHTFSISGRLESRGRITLNGVPIVVDQTKTDAEIMASLGEIKAVLFDLFGVSFTDVKIVRDYGSYSEHGVEFMYVYFYNAADNPLNAYKEMPLSDYICLSFDNFQNFSGDVVSDKILSDVSIRFYQYRAGNTYTETKRVSMISVEDAEKLLYNGYVFGGHACPLCMSMQSEVSFDGYEFVGLTYVFGVTTQGTETEGIPFYAFYKKIGTAKNGNLIYAKTYVPAVEVSGYEEYFEAQRENHRSGDIYIEEVE